MQYNLLSLGNAPSVGCKEIWVVVQVSPDVYPKIWLVWANTIPNQSVETEVIVVTTTIVQPGKERRLGNAKVDEGRWF